MYHSPDTPLHVKRIQQQIWMSKTIGQRLVISCQMIDDLRTFQTAGLKRQHPHWDDEDVRIHRLKLWVKREPKLFWLQPIIDDLEQKQAAKRLENYKVSV